MGVFPVSCNLALNSREPKEEAPGQSSCHHGRRMNTKKSNLPTISGCQSNTKWWTRHKTQLTEEVPDTRSMPKTRSFYQPFLQWGHSWPQHAHTETYACRHAHRCVRAPVCLSAHSPNRLPTASEGGRQHTQALAHVWSDLKSALHAAALMQTQEVRERTCALGYTRIEHMHAPLHTPVRHSPNLTWQMQHLVAELHQMKSTYLERSKVQAAVHSLAATIETTVMCLGPDSVALQFAPLVILCSSSSSGPSITYRLPLAGHASFAHLRCIHLIVYPFVEKVLEPFCLVLRFCQLHFNQGPQLHVKSPWNTYCCISSSLTVVLLHKYRLWEGEVQSRQEARVNNVRELNYNLQRVSCWNMSL